jgi:DNA-binding MarR family transcriptional regulator
MRHTAEVALARMRKNWPKAVTPTAEVMLRVYRLNDLARANVHRQASRHGLSLTEFGVLSALRSAPMPHELSPTELYSAVLISSGGLTKVLHGLEHRGLIGRVEDDVDRRSRRVRLTSAGQTLAERTLATLQSSGEELLSNALSTAEMTRLAALLRKVLLAFEPES